MSVSPEARQPEVAITMAQLTASKVSVPAYVVYRDFAHETVLLNLRTGKYHGLNPSGGVILTTLESEPTVAGAIEVIARRYGRHTEEIEQDVYDFCVDMLERSLIELADGSD